MPLNRDYSIVADSTISSSPEPSTPAPVIKRVPRTYGRAREPIVEDPDTSFSHSDISSVSLGSVYSSGPRDTDEELLPSSEPRSAFLSDNSDDEEKEGSDDESDAPEHIFEWKKKLEDIDKAYSEAGRSASGESTHATQAGFGAPFLLTGPEEGIKTHPASPAALGQSALSSDIFGSTLSSFTISSASTRPSSLFPPPVAASRRHSNKRVVVHDSESESELPPKNTSSTSASPVAFPHPITTPKSHSSQTPPTSDDEMPGQSLFKTKSKAKGKVPSRIVPPLSFEEPDILSSKSHSKKKSKIKAPTKKDLKETAKDRVRLAAEQTVNIPRGENRGKFTLDGLFNKLKQASNSTIIPTSLQAPPSSDPIQSFSSPELHRRTDDFSFHAKEREKSPSPKRASLQGQISLPALADSDDELTDVPQLIAETEVKPSVEEKRRKLIETKQRWLSQHKQDVRVDDSDDDIEIVSATTKDKLKVAEAQRKQGHKKNIIDIQRQRMKLPIKPKPSADDSFSSPAKGSRANLHSLVGNGKKALTMDELNRTLAQRVLAVNREVTRQKEEEWVQRGGRAIGEGEPSSVSIDDAQKAYAERGLKAAEDKLNNSVDYEEEDEDGSDGDWAPELRGSASPEPGAEEDEEEDGDDENDENMREDEEEDFTMVNEDANIAGADDEVTDKENVIIRTRNRRQAVVDSDDSDTESSSVPKKPSLTQVENFENSLPVASLRRQSTSSLDEPTDDEKENSTEFMFADKENQAVSQLSASRPPLGTRTGSLSGLEHDIQRGLSMSPGLGARGLDENDMDTDSSAIKRVPFGELSRDSSFSSQAGPSNLTQTFVSQLQRASASTPSGPHPPAPTLSPAAFIKGDRLAGFSQFSDDESVFEVAPVLQGSFSDLFEATQKSKKSSNEFASMLKKPSRSDSFALTQDISLAPAFLVDENRLRKADMILEKEQEYIVDIAARKPQQEDEFFHTQTKLISPTQTPASQRAPLRTLSLMEPPEDSPEQSSFHRLRKRSDTPPKIPTFRASPFNSPSQQKQPVNAFDLLRNGAANVKCSKGKRKPLDLSEFVEAEAQESDEEDGFGFGKAVGVDDEEDGAHLDQNLETLVDDQELDEEAVAQDLVIEKFKEHELQDDAALEKLHQAAIQGELRKKRKHNGIDLGDSDEDSDEEERNRRIRNKMKKPRVDRDTIRSLATNEQTRAFYEAYKHGVDDEDDSFAYLQQSESQVQQQQDVVMGNVEEEQQDVDDDEDDERRYVSKAEIDRQVRELAQNGDIEEEEPVDMYDVSWIEAQSEDEDGVLVKTVSTKARKPGAHTHTVVDSMELENDLSTRNSSAALGEAHTTQLKKWSKLEGRSHNGGTARRGEGSAVTGHGKAKAKIGGGTLRNASASALSASASGRSSSMNRLKAAPSILAGLKRDARFG
ncbi:hypothetical protein BDQ12DRAFT_661965 [Crucibulum laeve]|uniref:DNA replication checkpoint mediator MRC1 domain-containing protein n=1 Tax=Crucibulum laeve TaxID=68775 RepID=A0A5C3MPZ0_9AGAR|nr:hypothetical protein BDQ12DRAFT_661965 [Crucibulum laeve]